VDSETLRVRNNCGCLEIRTIDGIGINSVCIFGTVTFLASDGL
jgi:hypothetical protein